MKLLIKRIYTKFQVFGEGKFEDFHFKTLELPDLNNARNISCILEGEYTATKEVHDKFGMCFRLYDTPGRGGVLMHVGNYAGSHNPKTKHPDTEGCILPGAYFADLDGDGLKDIASSSATMAELYNMAPDKFTIKIYS